MKWKRSKKAVAEAKMKAEEKRAGKNLSESNQSEEKKDDAIDTHEDDHSDLDLDCENDDDSADLVDVDGRVNDVSPNMGTNVNINVKTPLIDQSNLQQCDIPTDLSMRTNNNVTSVHETLVR